MLLEKSAMENAWVHRLALVTAWATFALLVIGGLVTSKGAGLAVPDWPTTFGYQMFLYPWSKMIGGIFYEHSHRLVASGVGLLTLILAISLWFRDRRRWLCWLGTLALVLVIIQGVIGGLRVLLLKETLAILHASLAQAFFALAVGLAVFTSHEWKEKPEEIQSPDASRVRRLCALTTGMIYVQGIFGAVLRYAGTRLEVHLLLALLVTLHVLFLGARIVGQHADHRRLLRPALLLRGLLILQLGLGLGSFLGKFTSLGMTLSPVALEAFTTAHLLTGALMLATCLVLTLRSYRMLAPAPLVAQRFFSEQTPA